MLTFGLPCNLLQSVFQCGQSTLRMFYRSQGDANASVTTGVGTAIPYQHALASHGFNKCLVLASNIHQDEVRMSWPVRDFHPSQCLFRQYLTLTNLVGIPVDVSFIR